MMPASVSFAAVSSRVPEDQALSSEHPRVRYGSFADPVPGQAYYGGLDLAK